MVANFLSALLEIGINSILSSMIIYFQIYSVPA